MSTGRNKTGNPAEDEFFCQLYQQVTELQAARFSAGYDNAAGMDRFRTWLAGRTVKDQARPKAAQAARPGPSQAGRGVTGAAAAPADPLWATSAAETTPGPGTRVVIPGSR